MIIRTFVFKTTITGYYTAKYCSLINKINKLITIVLVYKPHIAAITETWLYDQIIDAGIVIVMSYSGCRHWNEV